MYFGKLVCSRSSAAACIHQIILRFAKSAGTVISTGTIQTTIEKLLDPKGKLVHLELVTFHHRPSNGKFN